MSKQDSSTDELFDLKNSFYLGNFQQAINEAQKLRVNDPKLLVEKDVYMYRAYIAQKKYGVVLDDIKPSATDELKYVRLMAEYLSSDSKKLVF
jgi:coatomer protein complex subunit epsilon